MKPTPVIIYKKRRPAHHAHHGGAWKVAYADFVTAMMAFFLVMWIIGQSKAVKASIAGYFKDPGIFEHERSTGIIPGGEMRIDPYAPARLRDAPSATPAADSREALETAEARIRKLLLDVPAFKALEKQIEITVTPEGLRIELIEENDSTFFDSGSAILKGNSVTLLTAIARELGKLKGPVIIEGHTDSQPYVDGETYGNWELSADRANAARRVMQRGGLHAEQLQGVRGYAATHLRVPDNPLHSRNRRVSIVVPNNAS